MAQVKFVKTRESRWLGNGFGTAPANFDVEVDGVVRARLWGTYRGHKMHDLRFVEREDEAAWSRFVRDGNVRLNGSRDKKAALVRFFEAKLVPETSENIS